jgi:hypothetical protein
LLSGMLGAMAAATSPSPIRRIDAPVLRTSSIRASRAAGRSRMHTTRSRTRLPSFSAMISRFCSTVASIRIAGATPDAGPTAIFST